MTFIIRTIGQRSGGGEIVRERPVNQSSIVIGRGTDCDLEVADLAVMLNHARVKRQGNHVEVEAIGGIDLVVDGKSRERADFGADTTAVLSLGSHKVTIAPGDGGATLVTLERVGALSDAADVADESKVFSLNGTSLSKRALAYVLIAATLLLFLAWPAISVWMSPPVSPLKPPPPHIQADASWTSGPLSSAHAGLSNKCGACHEKPFVAVRDSSCKACHVAVHDHADPKRLAAAMFDPSIEGKGKRQLAHLFNLPEGSCTSCHKEHEGPHGAAMTNATLCVDCHTSLSKRLPDAIIGDSSDFGSAHPEFRPSIVIAPAFDGAPVTKRVALNSGTVELNGLKFPHDVHLLGGGSVARMAKSLPDYGKPLDCQSCHRSDSSGARFVAIEMERDCLGCHSLAIGKSDGVVRTLRHGDAAQAIAEMKDFLGANPGAPAPPTLRTRPGTAEVRRASAGQSATARIRGLFEVGGTCYECHSVIPPSSANSLDFRIAPVSLQDRYLLNGWFSHGDHATAASPCETCHIARKSKESSDLLVQGIASCRECHAGAHPKGKQIATKCQDCHSFHAESPLASQLRAARKPALAPAGRTS